MEKNHYSISPKLTVKCLLDRFPEAAGVFIQKRMHCVRCPAEAFHTLEEIAQTYGMDMEVFLAEICRSIACAPDADSQ
ncbi:MAG: DUF1858 domain-containing protein [Desulfobacterales bacterium]